MKTVIFSFVLAMAFIGCKKESNKDGEFTVVDAAGAPHIYKVYASSETNPAVGNSMVARMTNAPFHGEYLVRMKFNGSEGPDELYVYIPKLVMVNENYDNSNLFIQSSHIIIDGNEYKPSKIYYNSVLVSTSPYSWVNSTMSGIAEGQLSISFELPGSGYKINVSGSFKGIIASP